MSEFPNGWPGGAAQEQTSSEASGGSCAVVTIDYNSSVMISEEVANSVTSVEELYHELNRQLAGAVTQLRSEVNKYPELENLDLTNVDKRVESLLTLLEGKINQRGGGANSVNEWNDTDIDMSPSDFYFKMFHGLNANKMNVVSMRMLYEHLSSASTQCVYASRFCDNPATDWNICYICGVGEVTDKSFECEHILPAFTSLGHYGLIQRSYTLSDTDVGYYKYEYANAHRCCNQIKADTKWLVYNIREGNYGIDVTALNGTLGEIHKQMYKPDGKYDCNGIYGFLEEKYKPTGTTKKEIDVAKNLFVKERADHILRFYLIPLMEMINAKVSINSDVYHLQSRIRQINALRCSFNDIACALVGVSAPRIPEPLIVEKMFETAANVQRALQTHLNDKCGPLFADIFIRSTNMSSNIDNERYQSVLFKTFKLGLRQGSRVPHVTMITSTIETKTSTLGKINFNIKKELVQGAMQGLTYPISETAVNTIMISNLDRFEQSVMTYLQSIGALQEFLQCNLPGGGGGGSNQGGGYRMIGGANEFDENLFDNTGYYFSDNIGPSSIRAPSGIDRSVSELISSKTLNGYKRAYISQSGRISTPVVWFSSSNTIRYNEKGRQIELNIQKEDIIENSVIIGRKYFATRNGTIEFQIFNFDGAIRSDSYTYDSTGNKINIRPHLGGRYRKSRSKKRTTRRKRSSRKRRN